MSGREFQRVAGQLAGRAITRADAIDDWVSLALEQPNPREWTNALVATALRKLETTSVSPPVQAEARLQLLDIKRAIHAVIAKHDPEEPRRTGWAKPD
jgi:hypothetical protein